MYRDSCGVSSAQLLRLSLSPTKASPSLDSAGNRDSDCRTTCAGPTPFSYALIDVYDKRVTCFFEGETGSGDKEEEKVEFGCIFDVDSGEYVSAVSAGTTCRSVSVEYGVCASD